MLFFIFIYKEINDNLNLEPMFNFCLFYDI